MRPSWHIAVVLCFVAINASAQQPDTTRPRYVAPFPNPFSDFIYIKHPGFDELNDRVVLYDLLGRYVGEPVLAPLIGLPTLAWDGTVREGELLPGAYYFVITNGSEILATHKVVFLGRSG